MNNNVEILKKKISKTPLQIKLNVWRVKHDYKKNRINFKEECDLIEFINQQYTEHHPKRFKKRKLPELMGLGILVIDLYESFDIDYSTEYNHYEYGTKREGMNRLEELLKAAKKHAIPIFAMTSEHPGSKVIPALSKIIHHNTPSSHILCKHLNPYTHNVELNSFESHELKKQLKHNKINTLIVAGHDRDRCVLASIKGALQNGFKVITSEQLMFTLTPHKKILKRRIKTIRYIKRNKNIIYMHEYTDIIKFIERKP